MLAPAVLGAAGWRRRDALAVAAAACLATPSRAAAPALRLAVSSGPVSLPVYVAADQGFFAREGLAVSLQACTSGREAFGLLRQGRADVATVAELLVALDCFDGAAHPLIATLSASSRHIKLVARRTSGIAAPEDLRGKRVATVAGTSAHYFLDSWLVIHAVDAGAVQLRPMAPDQLVPALQSGSVDAIAIWEPLAAQAIAALGDAALVLTGQRVYTQHFSLATARQTLARSQDALVSLLRALQRAERFIAEQPARLTGLLQAALHGGTGAALIGEHDFRLWLGQSLVATMDAQARWAVKTGQRPAPQRMPNLLHSIDPAPLRRAVPGAVELVL